MPESQKAFRCPCCGSALDSTRQDPLALLAFVKLGPQQRLLVERLAQAFGAWVPSAYLEAWIREYSPRGAELDGENLLNVLVRLARRQLRGTGLCIETGWGQKRLVWAPGAESADSP